MAAYQVLPYSVETLVTSLVENTAASEQGINAKTHKTYFHDYFQAVGAQTIIIEADYVDHDYLEDFAAYYVRCFQTYKRRTARFHFFSSGFSTNDFSALLAGAPSQLTVEHLSQTYLGFIVVKPLPRTVIGRTCLVTYPPENGRRFFPILRTYEVNLFGIPLRVKSLAYQEQDTVVAACATSALWSCFQGTGKLFQHPIPSPVEITKAATTQIPENLFHNDSRTLPNSGLTAKQMAHGIRSVGLEPYIVGTTDEHLLNSTTYAYLRGRIPSILAVQLNDHSEGKQIPMGGHAVAVTGYSLGRPSPRPYGPSGFLLSASRVDKIYAHDDQIGPFARMVHADGYMETTWPGEGPVTATPNLLLLPLYNKIRIPFSVIHDAILEVDALLEAARPHAYPHLPRPEWDLYLTTANDFKNDVFHLTTHPAQRTATLTTNLPRFLWRATAMCDDEHHLDLIFDATGIEQSSLILLALEFKPELPTLLSGLAPHATPHIRGTQAKAVFDYFSP